MEEILILVGLCVLTFHSVNQGIQLLGKGESTQRAARRPVGLQHEGLSVNCCKGCWKVWLLKDDSKQSEMNRHLIPTFKKIWHTLTVFHGMKFTGSCQFIRVRTCKGGLCFLSVE